MMSERVAEPAAPGPGHPSLRGPVQARLLPHGAVVQLAAHGVMLNLFPATLFDGGTANLWLRLWGQAGDEPTVTPLLGPLSPLRAVVLPSVLTPEMSGLVFAAQGLWQQLQLSLQLRLAVDQAAWFWHLDVHNAGHAVQRLDVIQVQDIGLAPADSLRINEYYASHYIDITPLPHPQHGTVLAARQNLPVLGRNPWLLLGSLGRACSYATDGLQLQGLAARDGAWPEGVRKGLPGQRLQHEHALGALQEAPVNLAPGQAQRLGFFGLALADHAQASDGHDLAWADVARALPAAQPAALRDEAGALALATAQQPSLFSSAPFLRVLALTDEELGQHFSRERRHAEHANAGGERGALLSFFHGSADAPAHVVLREKELTTQRPHGHVLYSGNALVPDEASLTSTVWMAGGFHSMLTQGHVSINCFLSTHRGWLGQYRSLGQRVFVDTGTGWQQLGVPSAFEMRPKVCRWLYRHATGVLEVVCSAGSDTHAMCLRVAVVQGAAVRVLVSHHVVLAGDDGQLPAPALQLQGRGAGVFVAVPVGSGLAQRFPHGGFVIEPVGGTAIDAIGGAELLHTPGSAAASGPTHQASASQPYVCFVGRVTAAAPFGLRLCGELVVAALVPTQGVLRVPRWQLPQPASGAAAQLADIVPWWLHNALVHYLAPRGLEQFSGGGWGTRDVCQGPLEMLLALDQTGPSRDLLCRVFGAQDSGGDWPQWFMFFERERSLRASDSHGDIVLWPLVALARYLQASGDAALLDTCLPFHDEPLADAATSPHTLWHHVQRALAVAEGRCIRGTPLVAYGHGDWNDSLQPANPALREHLCSAWTVTLHHQALRSLGQALAGLGQHLRAAPLLARAQEVATAFNQHLVSDGVVAGYTLFEPGQTPQHLLHPQDRLTGLQHSLLPMMHAVLEELLPPPLAWQQAALIKQHLVGPDGARLFDRPLPYRGGPMTLFQRAESSAFFGREVGVMYMHAHLRWAEMLAHLGQAEAFFDALMLAHPIALPQRLAQATRRQSNCYFSSSDAAFADRYAAAAGYADVRAGKVALDGGWRVYSSGPGIALGLLVRALLGVKREHHTLQLDPVLPHSLRGLVAEVPLLGRTLDLELQPGPLGHGPTRVLLGDDELPFARAANRYRTGGALLDLHELDKRLVGGARRLVVHTG